MSGPSFIIVGAQKAGTTSLAAMLADHPEVFMSDPKEPGYFIRGFDDRERWQSLRRPLGGEEAVCLSGVKQGVYTAQDYAALFGSTEARNAAHRGEASTPYLPSPHAARRISEVVPDAKIIVSLRDPVGRAYSAWGYNKSRGNENTASFEEAIEQELSGLRDDWIWGSRYLYAGLYAQHLQRYHEHFPRENILVLKFEDFRVDPAAEYARMCRFLGLEPQQAVRGERENVTVTHDNPFAARAKAALTTPGKAKSVIKALLPRAARKAIKARATATIDRFGQRPDALAPETRTKLSDYFRADCEALVSLVDFDLSDWSPMQSSAPHPTNSGDAHG